MGTLSLAAPLVLFREEQAASWHRVSPSPFLSLSHHTTQLHYTNNYTYSHPNLNFLQYTIQILIPHNVVCPSGAWIENRMRGFITSHPSTRTSVGHKLRRSSYTASSSRYLDSLSLYLGIQRTIMVFVSAAISMPSLSHVTEFAHVCANLAAVTQLFSRAREEQIQLVSSTKFTYLVREQERI